MRASDRVPRWSSSSAPDAPAEAAPLGEDDLASERLARLEVVLTWSLEADAGSTAVLRDELDACALKGSFQECLIAAGWQL